MPNNIPEPPDSVARLREKLADIIERTGIEDRNKFWHRDSSINLANEALMAITRDWLPREAVEAAIGADEPTTAYSQPGMYEINERNKGNAHRNRLRQEIRQRLNITVTDKREASDGE